MVMVVKEDITEFLETTSGNARIRFNDGVELILTPYRNWENIEGLDNAALYKNNKLEALVVVRPSRYAKEEESGFWSKGEVSQQQLAGYWNAAVEIGNQKRDEYFQDKIDENTWRDNFWGFNKIITEGWVARGVLEEGKKRVFSKKPKMIPDEI